MSGIYHGTKFGFIQSAIYDQMGVALEGRLANASDINLCDSISVGETNGVGVGYGVVISALSGAIKAGVNDQQVKLPTGTATAADFGGIVVRTDTGHTDANNNTFVAKEEIATVLRAKRVGGRIWVKAQGAITTGGDLYWVIADDSTAEITAGGFTGSAVTNKTVKLADVKVVAGAAKGGLALIELGVEATASAES